jgi:hypothetical protein
VTSSRCNAVDKSARWDAQPIGLAEPTERVCPTFGVCLNFNLLTDSLGSAQKLQMSYYALERSTSCTGHADRKRKRWIMNMRSCWYLGVLLAFPTQEQT